MEADSNLAKWAIENINSMAQTNSNNLNIIVECHTSGTTSWRYEIKNKTILQHKPAKINENISENIFNSAKWAFNKFPSKHKCIIFWNHGFGILETTYIEKPDDDFNWESEHALINIACTGDVCPLKTPNPHYFNHRAMLFSETSKGYLTNKGMIEAFKRIKNELLNGEKIDIIGTDCCKMAMLEIGYQIQDYANYLIGSQNCELLDGWDYKSLLDNFNTYFSPLQITEKIIDSYENYYKQYSEKNFYTLSAIDLSMTKKISDNLNYIIKQCLKEINLNRNFIKIIHDARSKCLKICDAPYYTDLDSFYTQLFEKLKSTDTMIEIKILEELKKRILEGKDLIKKAVVANTTGINMTDAKGVSIYFPEDFIDSSYKKTIFYQETLWPYLLTEIL